MQFAAFSPFIFSSPSSPSPSPLFVSSQRTTRNNSYWLHSPSFLLYLSNLKSLSRCHVLCLITSSTTLPSVWETCLETVVSVCPVYDTIPFLGVCYMAGIKHIYCVLQSPDGVISCQFIYSSVSDLKKLQTSNPGIIITFILINGLARQSFKAVWDLAGERLWLISASDYSQSALFYLYSHHSATWQAFSLQIITTFPWNSL